MMACIADLAHRPSLPLLSCTRVHRVPRCGLLLLEAGSRARRQGWAAPSGCGRRPKHPASLHRCADIARKVRGAAAAGFLMGSPVIIGALAALHRDLGSLSRLLVHLLQQLYQPLLRDLPPHHPQRPRIGYAAAYMPTEVECRLGFEKSLRHPNACFLSPQGSAAPMTLQSIHCGAELRLRPSATPRRLCTNSGKLKTAQISGQDKTNKTLMLLS